GYFLKKLPDEIRIGTVIRLLSGPVGMAPCVNNPNSELPCEECPTPDACGLREIIGEVLTATTNILDHETLASMMERSERLMLAKRDYMFHI
ncbi:transcriptional regulator, partial [bacterium]|nr:transcriptional regulator [bacterium]